MWGPQPQPQLAMWIVSGSLQGTAGAREVGQVHAQEGPKSLERRLEKLAAAAAAAGSAAEEENEEEEAQEEGQDEDEHMGTQVLCTVPVSWAPFRGNPVLDTL